MGVRSVFVSSKETYLFILIMMSMTGNAASGRAMMAVCDVVIVAVEIATVATIVFIVDTLVEADHWATQVVSCIEGRAAISLVEAPACRMTEYSRLEASSSSFTCSVGEWLSDVSEGPGEKMPDGCAYGMPCQRDVVETEVPYTSIDHPIRTERHDSPNNSASEALKARGQHNLRC